MILAFWLLACKDDPEGTPGPVPTVTDTGWFTTDTLTTTGTCAGLVEETLPEEGEGAWFWRDVPRVTVNVDAPAQFDGHLYGPSGQEVPTTLTWVEGSLAFDLVPAAPLAPDADHTLVVTDCGGQRRIAFHTDTFGAPLAGGPSTLSGRTWRLDLPNATWVQPQGLGPLLTLYFTTPVLLGVSYATPALLDLVGAPGKIDLDGALIQDPIAPTWDFPITDFDEQPFVSAVSDNVVFEFEDVLVPVEDFRFESTFAPDGARLGGTVLTGVADTRNLGSFAGSDKPDAICDLAETLGTLCIPCNDGEPYCLVMEVRDVDATELVDVTLVERN